MKSSCLKDSTQLALDALLPAYIATPSAAPQRPTGHREMFLAEQSACCEPLLHLKDLSESRLDVVTWLESSNDASSNKRTSSHSPSGDDDNNNIPISSHHSSRKSRIAFLQQDAGVFVPTVNAHLPRRYQHHASSDESWTTRASIRYRDALGRKLRNHGGRDNDHSRRRAIDVGGPPSKIMIPKTTDDLIFILHQVSGGDIHKSCRAQDGLLIRVEARNFELEVPALLEAADAAPRLSDQSVARRSGLQYGFPSQLENVCSRKRHAEQKNCRYFL